MLECELVVCCYVREEIKAYGKLVERELSKAADGLNLWGSRDLLNAERCLGVRS